MFELHKPCEPWSDLSRKGARLSWGSLHPKARDFLFTEGTLQQLSTDNAEYALALVAGDDLELWRSLPTWRGEAERTRKNPAVTYDPRQKAIWRMADTVFGTVAGSNGQQVLRTLKDTGRLGEPLGLPSATLSFHLSQLCHAGLVTFRRESRSLIYAAAYDAIILHDGANSRSAKHLL